MKNKLHLITLSAIYMMFGTSLLQANGLPISNNSDDPITVHLKSIKGPEGKRRHDEDTLSLAANSQKNWDYDGTIQFIDITNTTNNKKIYIKQGMTNICYDSSMDVVCPKHDPSCFMDCSVKKLIVNNTNATLIGPCSYYLRGHHGVRTVSQKLVQKKFNW